MFRSIPTWALVALGCAPVDALDHGLDGGREPDAVVPCEEDRFGLGTAELPATVLSAGTVDDLVVCDGRPDWFGIDAQPGARVRVDVVSSSAVEARLLDADGAVLAGGEAELRATVPPGGVRLSVAGMGRYALRIDLSALEGACEVDGDDRPEASGPLPSGARTVCAGDVDWYVVEAAPGSAARLEVEVIEGGEVEVAAYDAQGIFLAAEGPLGAARGVGADGRVLYRVRAADPLGEARYLAHANITPREGSRRGSRTGRAQAVDRALSEDGLGPPEPWPVAGVRVDAVEVEGGLVVGTALTDAEGRYTVDFVSDREVRAAAVAEVHAAGYVVRVEDRHGDVWRGDDAALHVAATAAAGVSGVPLRAHAPEPVRYRWRPGAAAEDCNTCFRPGQRPVIDLSGKLSDPDEWDDAVVLHELGHYVAWLHSRDDSRGGRHRGGARVAPEVAWSEGWATFFASWAMGGPIQLDRRASGVRVTDLDSALEEAAFGVDGERVSEALVAAVLWDLFDGGPNDDDEAAVPEAALWSAFAELADGEPPTDLADFIDALTCGGADEVAVMSVLEGREYPYSPPTCP